MVSVILGPLENFLSQFENLNSFENFQFFFNFPPILMKHFSCDAQNDKKTFFQTPTSQTRKIIKHN